VTEETSDEEEATKYELPEPLKAIIAKQLAEGITYEVDWRADGPHGLTGIRWRPGDPNPLAQAIIAKVTDRPLILDLAGQRYVIHREEGNEDAEAREAPEHQPGNWDEEGPGRW
jgi:hypothetical protein